MARLRPSLRIGGAALSLALVAALPAHAQRAPTGETIALRLLTELQTTSGVAGIGAAFWHNGRIVWTGSAGLRDVAGKLPVTVNTRFRFASISKILAATAAARLWQEGKLDVDAPVAPMLPWLKTNWAPFTTRQLAAHLSGIGHYQGGEDIGAAPTPDMKAAVAIFSGRPLLSTPGSKFTYSSYGYTLMSAIVETKAGRPYLDYLATSITPGLTIDRDYTGRDPNASRNYMMAPTGAIVAPARDLSYSWGGAGMGGTPSALATWGGRRVTGTIVPRATVQWMATPARTSDGKTVSEGDYTIGFGWRTGKDLDGNQIMHHAGATYGARGALIVLPGKAMAFSLLSNTMWTASIEKTTLAIAAPLRPAPKLAARPCPVKAARYKGLFDGEAIAGTASFAVDRGICTATLSSDNALGKWITNATRLANPRIRFIGIDPKGGLPRGALISPFGAWEMRPDASGVYAVSLGSNRSLTLTFE